LASIDATIDRPTQRVLLFGVGGRAYGCAIEAVREILPFRRCTRLPGAPSYVCGLINLRGTLVTVLDLGLRLGGAPIDRVDGSVILVELGAKVVGLAVDEMRDVQRFGDEEIEPASGDAARDGIIRGLGRLGDDVVVLLDVQAIVRHVLL
jgi:purine-binding chemotaxis protein CheW